MKNFENYDASVMPLSNEPNLRLAQEKVLNNLALTMKDKIVLGRDHPVKVINGYELKSNCVYRAISEDLYNKYLEVGFVYGISQDDEYIEHVENGITYNNNRGVDWYLGGVCLRYGSVVIECPASKEYFVPAIDNGCHLSADPSVRHMKSSGYKKPVPMNMVRLIKHPKILIDINELETSQKQR